MSERALEDEDERFDAWLAAEIRRLRAEIEERDQLSMERAR